MGTVNEAIEVIQGSVGDPPAITYAIRYVGGPSFQMTNFEISSGNFVTGEFISVSNASDRTDSLVGRAFSVIPRNCYVNNLRVRTRNAVTSTVLTFYLAKRSPGGVILITPMSVTMGVGDLEAAYVGPSVQLEAGDIVAYYTELVGPVATNGYTLGYEYFYDSVI